MVADLSSRYLFIVSITDICVDKFVHDLIFADIRRKV